MLRRLQQKWNVGPGRLFLILVTFALGGSLTGYAGKKIMRLTDIGDAALYVVCYILLVTLLWPFMVLLVSLPLGQFFFFKNYIGKLGKKITGK